MPITIKENGKMTLTINPELYGKLLVKFQPKVITTQEENERAIAIVETLASKSDLSPEEDEIMELLVTLIENFESKKRSINNLSTPHTRLLFLMESNNFKKADLVEIFGAKEIVDEVIHEKKQISRQAAFKLGEKFNVDPALFLV